MVKLLDFRAKLIDLYKKTEFLAVPLIKFAFAYFVFLKLDTFLDQYDSSSTFDFLSKTAVKIILSLVVTYIPDIWFTMIIMLITVGRVTLVSIEAGIITFIVLLIIYLLFLTMFREKAILSIITGLALSLNLSYVVPIMVAIFVGPVAIVPVAVGIIVYYLSGSLEGLIAMKGDGLVQMPFVLIDMYKFFISQLASNKIMLITIFVFAVVILATYYVSRLEINYAHYMAIGFGAIVMVFGFIIVNTVMKSSISIPEMVKGTLIAVAVAIVAQFLRFSLDYKKVEKHQFEDDDYYYYVKAIPKIKVPEVKKQTKTIK